MARRSRLVTPHASRFSDAFDDTAAFGWRLSVPRFDWPSLVAAKDREITRLEGLYGAGQESAGVEVVRSRAVLEDAHTVRLLNDGRRVGARTILIATGARPELPPFAVNDEKGSDQRGRQFDISFDSSLALPLRSAIASTWIISLSANAWPSRIATGVRLNWFDTSPTA
jgi:pyruvate/2-oxoglutarate dehydrogenase complex dihydrolipoamide dehydrogenase (E3) component